MTHAITTELSPELTLATDHLATIGAALVSSFQAAPFPVCSRLSRAIRTAMSHSDIWKTMEPDTLARADAMLRDIQTLRLFVEDRPCLDPEITELVHVVGEILLGYRAALNPLR